MPKQPHELPDDCAAVLPLLESYLDDELSPTESEGVREHLARCPACAAELRLAEAIQIGLRALPELDTPPEVLARVRALAAEETAEETAAVLPFERPAPKLSHPGRFRFATLAAALVLALLGGLFLFQLRSPRPAPQPSAATPATPAEVARATAEARYALACIGRASRRAGLEIKDDVLPAHLVAPAVRGLSRSLGETLNSESTPKQGS
jgi:anti-sigma factor RsiW